MQNKLVSTPNSKEKIYVLTTFPLAFFLLFKLGLFAPRVSRDGRRGQGMRPSLSQNSLPRNGLSQRQLMLNDTPETSPVARRDLRSF